jgi:hypothetical protein
MNDARRVVSGTRALPWHGWLAGGVLLLFGIAAAFDHGMSLALGAEFYRASGMSEAQVGYFSAVPAWAITGWTLSVWGGLLAAAALLLRRRQAGWLFAASLLGGLVYILYVLVLSEGRQALGVLWMMPLVMAAITALMVRYCQRLTRRGVLR